MNAFSSNGDPRCHFIGVEWLGQHLGRHAVAPLKRVTRVHVPVEPEMRTVSEPETVEDSRVLCEPLRHLHTPAPVLWCQRLANLYPVWMEAQVFAQNRIQ